MGSNWIFSRFVLTAKIAISTTPMTNDGIASRKNAIPVANLSNFPFARYPL